MNDDNPRMPRPTRLHHRRVRCGGLGGIGGDDAGEGGVENDGEIWYT